MFASRLFLRTLGRLLLAVMLFAQLATAVEACVMPRHAPLVAEVAAADEHHCHDMESNEAPAASAPMSANLCAAQSGDQSVEVPAVTVHAMPALPVLAVSPVPETPPAARLPGAESRRTTGDPPLSILFQVFRS